MKRKTVTGITLTLLFIGMLTLAFIIARAQPPATEWTYGRDKDDSASSVVETSDGGYALAGSTKSFDDPDGDFWLVKVNSTGGEQWNKTYGCNEYDAAVSVVETSDGGYVIAGSTTCTNDTRYDFWLVKTYANGTMHWNTTYGNVGSDEMCFSMIKTADGGYALAGALDDPHYADVDDFLLVKVNSTGNHQWNKTYGGCMHACLIWLIVSSSTGALFH